MLRNCLAAVLLLLSVAPIPVSAMPEPATIESSVTSTLVGKSWYLRDYTASSKLHYIFDGHTLVGKNEDFFTLSVIAVEKVNVTKNKVEINGSRVLIRPNDPYGAPEFIPMRIPVQIQVDLAADASSASLDQLPQLLFYSDLKTALKNAPARWRYLLPGSANPDPLPPPGQRSTHIRVLTDHGTEEVPAFEVQPPKTTYFFPLKVPDAAYRQEIIGYEAVAYVIGADGKPGEVWLVQPLGLGLDEAFYQTIHRSRYEPAVRKGVPVAVQLYLQANLRH